MKEAIAEAGTWAVKTYVGLAPSVLAQHSAIREEAIHALMAERLARKIGTNGFAPRSYVQLAQDLGIQPDHDAIGQWQADLAIYDAGGPSCSVEVKIFDERGDIESILADLHKCDWLLENPGLGRRFRHFVAIMVCETEKADLPAQFHTIEARLGVPLTLGPAKLCEPSGNPNDDWEWCFACAERTI
jgi:hypothetical protein